MTDITEVYCFDLPVLEHMLAKNFLLSQCNVSKMDSYWSACIILSPFFWALLYVSWLTGFISLWKVSSEFHVGVS